MTVTSDGDRWSRSPAPPWALAVLAAMLALTALSYQRLPWWALAGALLAPAAATAALRTYPLISLGVCVGVSAATAPAMSAGVPVWGAASSGAVFVISFLAGRRTSRPAPPMAVLGAGAVLVIPLGLAIGDVWVTALLLLGFTVALPWLLGRSVQQQSDLVAIAAERARLQERTRIAHDMHDTLGHELSLLALRAGALEMGTDLGHRHRTAAADLRAGAEVATERLADIITVLRDGDPVPLRPVSDRIEDVIDRAVEAGMAISLERPGPRRLPPMVDRAVHRVIQEALTNAMKHAPGTQVQVRLDTRDATTTITVTNPLSSATRRGTGARAGLAGLGERVRLAGGTLHAGPRGHSFQVVATLPHPEAP